MEVEMGEGGARNAPEKQDIQFIEHFLARKGGDGGQVCRCLAWLTGAVNDTR